MTSFIDLWGQSKRFRSLFLYNGIFPSAGKVDVGLAELLWWQRYPQIEWDFCGHEGCKKLVPEGECCPDHAYVCGRLPSWKWGEGTLYHYLVLNSNHEKRAGGVPQYRAYYKWMGRKLFGKISNGYRIYWADRNPFNLREDNLIVLSRIGVVAIEEGILTVPGAIEMDDALSGFIGEKFKLRRPPHQWVYTYQTIADVVKRPVGRIRDAVVNGWLDPSSLVSVVDFCQKCLRSDNV